MDHEELEDKVKAIEKTLFVGNGHPSITTQVAMLSENVKDIKATLEAQSKRMDSLESKINKLDKSVNSMAVKLSLLLTSLSIVVPLVMKFLFKV